MTNKNKNRFFKDSLDFLLENIKINKFLLILVCVISLITMLTGIIVAIKTNSSIVIGGNFGVVDASVQGYTTSFFTRFLSMMFMMLILFACSFTIYTIPLSIIFISYRSYLLGLNICLIIINQGFSGALVSILVAFPCQVIALALMILFYITLFKTNKDYKQWGGCRTPNQKLKIIVSAVLAMFVLCLIESIFLLLFSAKFILVI